MGTGQNGVSGKNARGAVDAATEPGPELAIIHQLNTVGGRVTDCREAIMCNIRPCPGENPEMGKTCIFLTHTK